MINAEFYIAKLYRAPGSSVFQVNGSQYNLEKTFPGLHYKSMTGLNTEGSQRVYEEKFVEEAGVKAYVQGGNAYDVTDLVLTLVFTGKETDADDVSSLKTMQSSYESFMNLIEGGFVMYRDTIRNRAVVMYRTSAPSVKSERLYGVPYRQIEFKFRNVLGQSYPYDNKTTLSKVIKL